MKLEPPKLPPSILTITARLARFRVVLFTLFVVVLFGYVGYQFMQASNVSPTTPEDAAQAVRTPRIDPETVTKLEQLEDNSVGVKALFNEARTNPFQ